MFHEAQQSSSSLQLEELEMMFFKEGSRRGEHHTLNAQDGPHVKRSLQLAVCHLHQLFEASSFAIPAEAEEGSGKGMKD